MIDKKTREEIEYFLIEFMDSLDPTKINSEYLQEKFAEMSDAAFYKWLQRRYPLQLQVRQWEIEPNFRDFKNAAKVIGIPLTSKICMPSLYVNKDGIPVNTEEALIMALPLKKTQQFNTHKTKISIDIDDRDMKSGRLNVGDKGAATSDKEFQSMAVNGLYRTMEEFSTIKADALQANAVANAQIMATGTLSQDDYVIKKDDSLSRNMIYSMLIGCLIETNLVGEDGMTPYTIKERQMRTNRETD